MKHYKSDGRYKFHNRGLCYIADFRWASLEDRALYSKLVRTFEEMYGPAKERTVSSLGYNIWKANENWQFEQNRSAKRRRIYLKEESALSLALLKVGVV